MRHHARVDDVRIESEDQGFELHIDTEDGDTFVFNIQHLAWDLAGQADRTICAWRREGEGIRTEVLRSKPSEFSDDGYDPSDPKHRNWHSVHADHYDNRAKGGIDASH